jgi:predicted outer membrane repeat protein
MAVFTNAQFLDSGTARTAGEVHTFNGGSLTVRTDTRWHANAPANMTGTFGGNSVISASLGGELFIDAREVRWMPYTGGSGSVPAIGTTITRGGVSAYLLGAWASLTAAPTAVGAAMINAPYSNITVSYFTANQVRNIGGVPRNFKIIVAGNGATLEQIYTKIQFLLRQSTNINTAGTAGVKTGKIQNALLSFVGDTLGTSQSVFIDNIQGADSNRIEFFDDANVLRTNPFSSAGTISFNTPLVGAGSSYRLMFTAPLGADNDFGEAGAVTVNDAAGIPITGTISAVTVEFTYDYAGNVQGGAIAGTDRAVTLIAIRPGSGKYVAATGTITRSKSIALSLVAEADRVYR